MLGKEARLGRYLIPDFIYTIFWRRQTCLERGNRLLVSQSGGRRDELVTKQQEGIPGGEGNNYVSFLW